MDRDRTRADYTLEDLELATSACLHLALVLGAFTEEFTLVGGLVPSLLVPQTGPSPAIAHAGTKDVDLGLAFSVLDEQRYASIADTLREAGFAVDTNERGNNSFFRWRTQPDLPLVTVDFLLDTADWQGGLSGTVAKLDSDFGVLLSEGLHLVWKDRHLVRLSGPNLRGQRAKRDLWVCGPGAFVILKALALRGRYSTKDAYDLDYLLRYYGSSLADIVSALRPLQDDPVAQKALGWLADDYATLDSTGPGRLAEFHQRPDDDELKADAQGLVQLLLRELG